MSNDYKGTVDTREGEWTAKQLERMDQRFKDAMARARFEEQRQQQRKREKDKDTKSHAEQAIR